MALRKREYIDGRIKITAKNLNEIQDAIIALENAAQLIIPVLRNGIYNSDQSVNITKFEYALACSCSGDDNETNVDPDAVTYTVTNELVNVTSDNDSTVVQEGSGYTASLTPSKGYTIDMVAITMGGEDITATAYVDGVVTISAVTGNVEIIVSTSVTDTTTELVTDGLLAYFDFRTATYNNTGAGGSTTIAATHGDGHLFAWANNCVEVQDEYGIHFANTRNNLYSKDGNTTETVISTPMTLVMLTYGHVMFQGFNYTNTGARWAFKPQYNNASGSIAYATQHSGNDYNADVSEDYNFCVYRVDGNVLTEIMDTSVATYVGSDIDGFASWQTMIRAQVQNATTDGHYCTAAAIYNRALTDVEIEEVRAFMKTLEVV